MRASYWVGFLCFFSLAALAPAASTFDEAVAAYNQGQFDQARQAFAGLLQANPQDAQALDAKYYLALSQFSCKDYSGFTSTTSELIPLAPQPPAYPASDSQTSDSQPVTQTRMAGMAQGSTDGEAAGGQTAQAPLQPAPALTPERVENLQWHLAVIPYIQGKWAEAHAAIDAFATDHPDSTYAVWAQSFAATSLYNQGSYDEFKLKAAAFLQDHPAFPTPAEADQLRLKVATVPMQQRKWDEAITSLEAFALAHPDSDLGQEAQIGALVCRFNGQKFDEFKEKAEAYLQQHPSTSPKQVAILRCNLALIPYLQGKWAEAQTALDAFAAQFPADAECAPQARVCAAQCLYEKGEYDGYREKAQGLLKQPESLNQDQTEKLHYYLAMIHYQEHKWDEAGKALEQFAATCKDQALSNQAQYAQMECLFAQGDYEVFAAKAKAFVEAHPTAPNLKQAEQLRFNLALAPFKQNKWSEAYATLDHFAAAYTDPALVQEAQYHATLCLYEQGAYDTFKQKADEFLEQHKSLPKPQQEELQFRVAMTPLQQRQWQAAADQLQQYLGAHPSPEHICSAMLMRSRALRELAADQEKEGGNKDLAASLADQAKTALQQAVNNAESALANDKDLHQELMVLEYCFGDKNFPQVLGMAQKLCDHYQSPALEWATGKLWLGIARANMLPQDLNGSAEALDAVLQAKVEDASLIDHVPTLALYWRAVVAQNQGDSSSTLTCVRKIRDQMPQGPARQGALKFFASLVAADGAGQ